MERPQRKRPAHQPVFNMGNRSEIVFVTVCIGSKRRLLDNESAHALIKQAWLKSDHWLVGRYVIMPDHIHLFCAPARYDQLSVKRWIAYWKSIVTRGWPNPKDKPLWQRDGWDIQLRRGESYSAKWRYISENPVRAGLAQRADEWLYQGELNQFAWHD
jgi:REP element-mobilizing transposase RayT